MAYDAEKQMLRELAWFLLPQLPCFFCNKPLAGPLTRAEFDTGHITFGHRRHGRVGVKITIHHKDENRDNNKPENLTLCHRGCHEKYHKDKKSEMQDPGETELVR